MRLPLSSLPAVCICLLLSFTRPASAIVLINEAVINPSGTDDTREYVELFSTNPMSDTLNNVWLLEIETDAGTARGTVDLALNLTGVVIGSNGFVLIGHNYLSSGVPAAYSGLVPGATTLVDLGRSPVTTIEQDVALLLVSDFTGSVGIDYDTDNDGIFDTTPWSTILDSVALRAATLPNYALGGTSAYLPSSGTPDAVARFTNVLTANTPSGWVGGEFQVSSNIVVDVLTLGASSASGTTFNITPGYANELSSVPEPSRAILLMCGLGALFLRRRRVI